MLASAVTVGPATWAAETEEADAFWDRLQRAAFALLWEQANANTGLVRNTTEPHAPASITAMGASLSGIPIAVERGWVSRAAGYQRALRTLRTMTRRLPHEHGFFYHFLDPRTGKRTWRSEVSCIDTAIAIAGALVVGQYFKGTEVEGLARAVYERADWPWFLNGEETLVWGWKPETGFEGGPIHFSEGILAYLLALGSPTHPIPAESWHAMWRPVSRYKGQRVVFVHDGSLFTYLLPLAWLDLRNQHDAYLDYWTNARRAVLANRQFCKDQEALFKTYAEGFWGLSAALGPDGYRNYGGKPGVNVHDGTVAPYVVAASAALVPELALATTRAMVERFSDRLWGRYGLTDAFNLDRDFFCPYYIALDQALVLLMVENYRSGLIWRLMSDHPAIRQALARAGFVAGAQEEPTLSAARRGNPGARVALRRVSQPVQVDGHLGEWAADEPLELIPTAGRNVEFGFVRSGDDASLYAYVGWDDERLYVAGIGKDDELANGYEGEAIHRDDCVEVFLDLDADGFRFDRNPLDAQVGLAPTGPQGRPQVWVWGAVNRAVPEVEAAVIQRPGAFLFELAVPWSVIGGRPKTSQPFRFTVAYHDRDRDGNSAKLVWSVDKETDPERLLFGEARLVP